MKTFEESVAKVINVKDYTKFAANMKCEFDNLKDDPVFQKIIRVTLDETIIRMINESSPTLAITGSLIAIAQTFLLIGMEMEKE